MSTLRAKLVDELMIQAAMISEFQKKSLDALTDAERYGNAIHLQDAVKYKMKADERIERVQWLSDLLGSTDAHD